MPSNIYNLENAFSYLTKYGILKPNRYYVYFSVLPSSIRNLYKDPEQVRLKIACESVDLPVKTIVTDDVKVGKHIKKSASSYTVDPIKITYRCSGDMMEKYLFDKWLDSICDMETGLMGYPAEFVADLFIDVLNDDGEIVYGVKLVDAFPTSISSTGLAFQNQNDTLKIDVQIAYKKLIVRDEFFQDVARDLPNSNPYRVFGEPWKVGIVPAKPSDGTDSRQNEISTIGADAKRFLELLGLTSDNTAFDWNAYLADPNQWGANNTEDGMYAVMQARGDILSQEVKDAIAGNTYNQATADSAVDILTDQADAVLSVLERLSPIAVIADP